MDIKIFRKLLPKSISSRFFLILVSPVVFSQLIFGYIFFGRHTETIINCVSTMVAGDIKTLFDFIDSCDLKEENKEQYKEIANTMEINIEIVQNADLSQKTKSHHNRVFKALNKALSSKGVNRFYIKSAGRQLVVYVPSEKNYCVYKFSFLKKKIYSRTIPIVTLWGIASAIILLFIAFVFLKNQIRPIKRLATAMEDFGSGRDEHHNYKPEGATEIRAAWTAFFNMRNNFRKLITDRMNTLAGISHDLRTPLTRMRLQIALMPQNEETAGLLDDITMMTKITESFMLHVSKLNNESFSYQNLAILLERIAKKHNFPIEISGDRAIEVFIKPVSFKRVIENIISNAEKYASILYINFYKSEGYLVLDMEDNGKGIDSLIIRDIFTPFFSANKARTKRSSSANVGLGLSIARDIISSHGGEIKASNSERHSGAKFTIKIPEIDVHV